MFRIANITKLIFRSARNIQQTTSISINSIFKHSSQSKGYIEDAADECGFESFSKIPPQQAVTKDQFKATTPIIQAPIFQGTNKLGSIGSYKILDSAETRKLIYARFADEIVAKTKKITDTVATNDIREEFNKTYAM